MAATSGVMDQPPGGVYAAAFVAAFVASSVLTPLARRFATRIGVKDEPGRERAHLEAVSLLGGLAIYAGTFLAAWFLVSGARTELKGFFLAGLVVLVFGLQDDITPMDPWVKLLAQATSALVLVGFGTQVALTGWPVLDVALTIAWVVAVINAFNYSDNMNGLAAGLATISGAGFFVLALMGDQYLVATLAVAVAGGALGFLPSNFPRARIFMGDAGSMFLGLLLAFLGIQLSFLDRPRSTTFLLPVLVLAVPLADASLVTISRLRRGLRITHGGSDHASHRLVTGGLPPWLAVVSLWAVQTVACLGALAVLRFRAAADAAVIAAVTLFLAGGLVYLERAALTNALPRKVRRRRASAAEASGG